MLNSIKEMIATKSTFLEAADMLFEDGSGTNIDNTIVLGEEAEEEIDDIDEGGDPEIDNEEENKESNDEDTEDILNSPIDEPKPEGDTGDTSEDDILNAPIDSNPSDPSSIPTPVGAQTGEPIDGIDDILNAEIDLKSNTMKDVLPVPPATANDAVSDSNDEMDNFMNQRIDTGYGGDTATESTYTEGISLDGGDGSGDEGSSDTSDSSGEDESSSEPAPDDNTVTSAVKDKVEEMQDDSSDITGDDSTGSSSISQDKKDELMKKLGNLTKGLEDAKKAIIDAV